MTVRQFYAPAAFHLWGSSTCVLDRRLVWFWSSSLPFGERQIAAHAGNRPL